MTETMLERMARAIKEADLDAAGPDAWHPIWETRLAKAALQAIMEPSDLALNHAEDNLPYSGLWSEVGMNDVWKAMIQSILSEEG